MTYQSMINYIKTFKDLYLYYHSFKISKFMSFYTYVVYNIHSIFFLFWKYFNNKFLYIFSGFNVSHFDNFLFWSTFIKYNSFVYSCKSIGLSDTYNIFIIHIPILNIWRCNHTITDCLLKFCLYKIKPFITNYSYNLKSITIDYSIFHQYILNHNDIFGHTIYFQLKLAAVTDLFSHELILMELHIDIRHYIIYTSSISPTILIDDISYIYFIGLLMYPYILRQLTIEFMIYNIVEKCTQVRYDIAFASINIVQYAHSDSQLNAY